MAKRLLDIGVSVTVLLALALPMAAVALAIRLSDGKPVFFSQRRIGRGGRPFRLYKFRTMKVAAGGSLITADGDHRITSLGRVLRSWKIDELPQFWNILRGDMCVVGPRPEAERLVRHYTTEQKRLLDHTPGLAGMSQLVYPHEAELLRGHVNPEDVYLTQLMPKKIAVDLEYEHIRTFFSDLRLLLELVLFIVLGRSNRVDLEFAVQPQPTTIVSTSRAES
jgi:lipopolysaccharide/colanic/teichoic acid biosynthesis glycosyltransferase